MHILLPFFDFTTYPLRAIQNQWETYILMVNGKKWKLEETEKITYLKKSQLLYFTFPGKILPDMFVKREKRLKSKKNIQNKLLVPNPVQINRHPFVCLTF